MSNHLVPDSCDCLSEITRRRFLKSTVTGVAALAASGSLPLLADDQAKRAKTLSSTPETLVGTLYKSLTEEQRKAVVYPFDHPLRSKVDNNWNIVKQTIGDFFTKDQQAMVREIFRDLHSPEYVDKVVQQVEHDAGKEGFGGCSV